MTENNKEPDRAARGSEAIREERERIYKLTKGLTQR